MIHNTIVLSQIHQINQFNTAIHTFHTKYNAYPGDIHTDQADAFGFIARSGNRGSGDGNELIEGCGAGSGFPTFGCEFLLFWSDLGAAKMIPGSFNAATDNTLGISSPAEAVNYFPSSKLEPSYQVALLTELSSPNLGWFVIIQLTQWDSSNNSGAWATDVKTIDAYTIDTKIDDGEAMTGRVNGLRFFNIPGDLSMVDTPVTCIYNGKYNLTPTNTVGCQLNFHVDIKSM